mmetsp:Transcript_12882/g.18475  ORF Transcript_12882/g.18475 Transcript_12882/m.18475 type:complete len:224 (-) Transcript_12882:1215-1886(-)
MSSIALLSIAFLSLLRSTNPLSFASSSMATNQIKCSSRRAYFQSDRVLGKRRNLPAIRTRASLNSMNSLSDAFGKFFGVIPEQQQKPNQILFEIPVQNMKVGGLRFALGLHLMGQKNKPEIGAWKVNQANDGIIDLFYKDETGSLAVSFLVDDKKIVVERWGTRPSLQYQLQESLILNSMLDELQVLAYGNSEEVKDSDRLLTFLDPGDAIEKARATLPARSA